MPNPQPASPLSEGQRAPWRKAPQAARRMPLALGRALLVTTFTAALAACGAGGSGSSSNTGSGGSNTAGNGSGTNPSASEVVTASSSSVGGTISPVGNVKVTFGKTTTFTLAPLANYSAQVGGTCGGSLSGNTYTTNPITTACTVVASFAQNSTSTGTIAGCFAPTDVSFKIATPNVYNLSYISNKSIDSFQGKPSFSITEHFSAQPDGNGGVSNIVITQYLANSNLAIVTLGIISVMSMSSNNSVYTSTSTTISDTGTPTNLVAGQNFFSTSSTSTTTVVTGPTSATSQASSGPSSTTVKFNGYESLTLAGKTFTNVCHFSSVPPTTGGNWVESWVAPGFGQIKSVSHETTQTKEWNYGGACNKAIGECP